MNEQLQTWMYNNFIEYESYGIDKYKTSLGVMQFLPYSNCIDTSEKEMNLYLTYNVCEDILADKVQFIIYKFGGRFYYTPVKDITNIQFNELKYIGLYQEYLPKDKSSRLFAGVHGRYEVMNGTRDYEDWCTKAKFLKYESLAICEKNTLAGTLPFQLQCEKAEINSIIGYTAEVENENGTRYDLKLYCINHEGWVNLLRIINSGNSRIKLIYFLIF